ncbi:helicase C-terminal domain-containing protein [Cohnella rhizosphaerae]|uniref:helicase C-terminal domain-containing protein n=1 Tax=Cohnella rhizosphaerae TaxID=1457232 RepID=UPI003B8A8266
MGWKKKPDRRFLFEGDREITVLISEFQRDLSSVLCAVTLWEGLDVPGASLSAAIMWALPYPPNDPVFDAKRREADDPYKEVDLPYMLLRFRQGIGRLIRTREDRGGDRRAGGCARRRRSARIKASRGPSRRRGAHVRITRSARRTAHKPCQSGL